MASPVAFVGSLISHGGSVISGSPDTVVNSHAVARLGDAVICTTHGAQTITTASTKSFANARGIARIGDAISCGAIITTGSANVFAG